jgi:hypothetical protein
MENWLGSDREFTNVLWIVFYSFSSKNTDLPELMANLDWDFLTQRRAGEGRVNEHIVMMYFAHERLMPEEIAELFKSVARLFPMFQRTTCRV